MLLVQYPGLTTSALREIIILFCHIDMAYIYQLHMMFQETTDPKDVLNGGALLPLGGVEITSESGQFSSKPASKAPQTTWPARYISR